MASLYNITYGSIKWSELLQDSTEEKDDKDTC